LTHRARVVAVGERFLARRAPAGHWPIDARWPWITVAGSSLACAGCQQEGRAPLPQALGYNEAVEGFLAQHRACADRQEART
jgi:hypothetical protein